MKSDFKKFSHEKLAYFEQLNNNNLILPELPTSYKTIKKEMHKENILLLQ